MSWAQSLIRVRAFEIETLRKRLGAVMGAKTAVEMAIAALDVEAEAETAHARLDAEAGWYLVGFRDGWKLRKAKALAELKGLELEEQGARDALAEAFTELKKVEMVAEAQAVAARTVVAKRESAALDEIALRKTASGPA
jgi:flagellar FliJ protein